MVKLAYLENDVVRKARLKKRRAGLFKKLREISTLCGVDAFAIVYSPDDSQTAVWPTHFEAQQMLRRLQGMPEAERRRKTRDQESYLRERVEKAQLRLRKIEKKNKEMERSYLMHQFYHLEGKSLGDFGWRELHGLLRMLEEKIDAITARVDYFKQFPPIGAGHFAWGGPEVGKMGWADKGVSGGGGNPTEAMLWDPWLTKVISNTDNIMGSTSGTESGMGLPNAYSIRGRGPIGQAFELGPPYTGDIVDIIDFGLPPGNALNRGLPHANFAGNNGCGRNPIGLGLPRRCDIGGSAFGSNIGLTGISNGTGSTGLPLDINKPWPNEFSN